MFKLAYLAHFTLVLKMNFIMLTYLICTNDFLHNRILVVHSHKLKVKTRALKLKKPLKESSSTSSGYHKMSFKNKEIAH